MAFLVRICLFSAILFTGAHAISIQVLPAEAPHLDAGTTNTVQVLVEAAVAQAGHTVVSTESPVQLRTQLLPLGQSIMVVCTRLENGQTVHTAQFKALTPDELDMVLERTVLAALEGSSPKNNEEVGAITQGEEKEMHTRKESRQYKSMGFGPAFFNGIDNQDLAYVWHSGYLWEVGRQAAITLQNRVATSFTGWSLHNTFLIGGRYHFTATRFSPFLGLGAGLGASYGDALRLGFATGASAGVVLFRTSSTQLEIAANYDALFDSRDDGHLAGKSSLYLAVNY